MRYIKWHTNIWNSAKVKTEEKQLAQKRILEVFSLEKKFQPVIDVLHEIGILTVFDVYILEPIKKFLKQTSLAALIQKLSFRINPSTASIARKRWKGLKPSTYSRTVVQR